MCTDLLFTKWLTEFCEFAEIVAIQLVTIPSPTY